MDARSGGIGASRAIGGLQWVVWDSLVARAGCGGFQDGINQGNLVNFQINLFAVARGSF